MRTLDLSEAASMLKMSAEALRQRAKAGELRAYKPGKRWVFLESDLLAYLTGGYAAENERARLGVACRSTSAGKFGGSASRRQTDSEYTNLLKLPTSRPPRNTTTR